MDTFVIQFFVLSTWLNQEKYNSEIAWQNFMVLSFFYENMKKRIKNDIPTITKPKEFASYLYNIQIALEHLYHFNFSKTYYT